MKTSYLTIILLISFYLSHAQFGPQQVITTDADAALSVYATDLDGDGDMDVLSASYFDHKIAWYENTNGQGSFGSQQIITTDAWAPESVYATDIDGDGDMDVLSASNNDDKIAWYENDGVGNFGSQQIITTNASVASSVYATDIDGDGDMDVLSASGDNVDIAWYENDGDGNFGPQLIITIIADGAKSVYAADLDGDGDMDVLSASEEYLSPSIIAGKIAWYENDGDGNFGPQQILSTNDEGASSVYTTDIDNDGDMDVLYASFDYNKIAWHENDGAGNFGSQQIISWVLWGNSVYATDIDNDGDMDVLSASAGDDKVAWYENFHILSVNENTLLDLSVFPNPVKGILNILSNNNNPINSIQVYDILGRLIIEEKDDFNQIDVSNIDSGVLFVKINTTEGVATRKIIKE